MPTCKELNIPEHLWQKDRGCINDFLDDEQLYRRFKNPVPHNFADPDAPKNDDKITAFTGEIFQLKGGDDGDSYNRSKFCDTPEDVLISNNGKKSVHYGIFTLKACELKFTTPFKLNSIQKLLEVYIEHNPLKCNYAHSILKFKVNGEVPKNPKPGRTIKNIIRQELGPRIKVIKHPEHAK